MVIMPRLLDRTRLVARHGRAADRQKFDRPINEWQKAGGEEVFVDDRDWVHTAVA